MKIETREDMAEIIRRERQFLNQDRRDWRHPNMMGKPNDAPTATATQNNTMSQGEQKQA